MIFDYNESRHKITLIEEHSEDILRLKDRTTFTLCERIRDGIHEVPFISLPIIINAAKLAGYRTTFGSTLKKFYDGYRNHRQKLENIKQTKSDREFEDIAFDEISKLEHRGYDYKSLLTSGQKTTIKFMLTGKTILCGNEVGTGKTLAAIMASKILLFEQKISKIIVVTQSSLVQNWYNDHKKFFSINDVIMVSKSDTPKKRNNLYDLFNKNKEIHFIILNYEKFNFDFDALSKMKCDCLIVDEAHNFKNILTAKRSENFFKLVKVYNPKYRFALTGTPVENRVGEIFSMFKFLDDGKILGGEMFFSANFVSFKDEWFKVKMSNGRVITRMEKKPIGYKNHEFLKSLIRPYVIRIKTHLPVGLYEEYMMLPMTNCMRKKHDEIRHSTDNTSAKYHRLRQFLNSPTREGVEDDIKCDKLIELIDQTTEKILVFSFYRCSLNNIGEKLKKAGIKYLTFSGEDSNISPVEIIKKFEVDDYRVMITTDRLSTGCNIQFCHYCIQYDLPIKPSIAIQRKGRTYRIGQKNDVHVFNFIYENSIESVIYEQFEVKQDVIREIIDKLDDRKLVSINKDIERKVVEYLDKK